MALRVLLADESSTIKRVMQLALQDFSVEVRSVAVGLDVLEATKAFKPDVIFADVLLAKRNGYEVCAEIKADAETKNIPVILMWSSFMEVDESKISMAGPNARLEKPFDAEALRKLIQDLVPKTQNNPISSYLQFPKMPEFKEASMPPLSSRASEPKASGKIPDTTPVNFDQFDPTAAEDEGLYNIPEDGTISGVARPDKNLMKITSDEEFTSVPLTSFQQKNQLEKDDGWLNQDLKKFKIKMPTEDASPTNDDDFAKKFVIPQDDLDNAHIKADGEFEEIHFGKDETRIQITPRPNATSQTTPDIEMIERVIREEAREVIESICWKVIPEIAERIVREEITKILRDVEK